MNYYMATVVWYDQFTNEAAVLIDGRAHTTLLQGVQTLEPGQSVVIYEDGTFYVPVAV